MKTLANANSQAVIVGVAYRAPCRECAPLVLHESGRTCSGKEKNLIHDRLCIGPVIAGEKCAWVTGSAATLQGIKHLSIRPCRIEAGVGPAANRIEAKSVVHQGAQSGRKEVVAEGDGCD